MFGYFSEAGKASLTYITFTVSVQHVLFMLAITAVIRHNDQAKSKAINVFVRVGEIRLKWTLDLAKIKVLRPMRVHFLRVDCMYVNIFPFLECTYLCKSIICIESIYIYIL